MYTDLEHWTDVRRAVLVEGITDGQISRIQSRDELDIQVGTIDGEQE